MTEKIFIISCIVYAIHYSMLEDEIFSFIRNWWNEKEDNYCIKDYDWQMNPSKAYNEYKFKWRLMNKIRNPAFDCPVCMAPWWGTILYWLLFHNTVVEWIICIFAAMGLNYIIAKLSPEK